MAALIRFPDETDAEYQRRTRPLLDALSETTRQMYGSQLLKVYQSNDAITCAMRISELRRSCGVSQASTFKWDVYP